MYTQIKVKHTALSKVTQVMECQTQLCTTPGWIKDKIIWYFPLQWAHWVFFYDLSHASRLENVKPLTDCSSKHSVSKQPSTASLGFRGHFQRHKWHADTDFHYLLWKLFQRLGTWGALTLHMRTIFYQNTLLTRAHRGKIILTFHE